MRAGRIWVVGVAALVALAGCGDGATDTSAAEPAPAATTAKGAPTKGAPPKSGNAQVVVDALSKKWPASKPQDNTGSCAGDGGCVQLITTDAVSVYEFADKATAKRWVTEMKAQGDWRQAGRFALAWTARDQAKTSKKDRTDMLAAANKAAAGL